MDKKGNVSKNEKQRKRISITRRIRHFVIDDFDEIEDFNHFMKSAIKREYNSTSRRIEKVASRLDKDEREQYYEYSSDDYYRIGSVFEKLALDSFVVILYSRVETGMGTLCNFLRRDRKNENGNTIELRYNDLKGGPLDQAKLYMKKVLGLNLNLDKNEQWREILGLRELRNAIVHKESWLKTKNTTLKEHIQRGYIELKQQEVENNGYVSGYLRVKSEYTDHILSNAKKFFEDINF